MAAMPSSRKSPPSASANGIKSRGGSGGAPNSGPPSRRQSQSTNSDIGSAASSSSPTSVSFVKITTMIFIIAIADVLFVWHSIQSSIGGEHYELHGTHEGAEVGLHHLHEKRRMKKVLNEHHHGAEKNGEQKLDEQLLGEKVTDMNLQQQPQQQQYNKQPVTSAGVIHDNKMDQNDFQHFLHDQHIKMNRYQDSLISKGHKKSSDATTTTKDDQDTTINTRGDIDASSKRSIDIDPQIAKILHSANINAFDLDEQTASQLPKWKEVVKLYGDKAIIYGQETCDIYKSTVQPQDRMTGPAGIFNTGTNLYFELMKTNCNIKEARHSTTHREPLRNGIRWQAPWGKHNPVTSHRNVNVAKMWGTNSVNGEGAPIVQNDFLPVVTIKDPYSWMGSQCRHHYSAFWNHDKDHCPNLLEDGQSSSSNDLVPVMTKYAKGYVRYDSLVDMWNKWYGDYEIQSFPMLRTRFEDILFHGEDVTRAACECVGGEFTKQFNYIEGSAKENGMPIHVGANGLVKALIQYGNPDKRLEGMTERDQRYAHSALDKSLLEKYGYSYPPLPGEA